jgi:prophage maintenance system killer protein
MKKLMLIVPMLFFVVSAAAQSGRLNATIIDRETKEGVVGAIVEVVSSVDDSFRKHTTTGAKGAVSITGLRDGDYTMTVMFIGYATHRQEVKIKGTVDLGVVSLSPENVAIETIVKENIDAIIHESADAVDTAINLCLYCMKTQIFNDGNKRAAVIFANHYMITQGQGLLVIPQEHIPEFKRLLVAYYEDRDNDKITEFMRTLCWRTF